MTQDMPLTTLVAAIPSPRQDRRAPDLTRLLATWGSVCASAITAEAHDLPGAANLHRQLYLIEGAIQTRHPAIWRQLEASLIEAQMLWEHDGTDVSPAVCRVCRRIATGIPLDLPLPAQGGAL